MSTDFKSVIALALFLNIVIFFISTETSADSLVKDPARASADSSAPLLRVNENYLKSVRPIFESKCFDCHSSHTVHPWYYSLPLVKQLIDRDVKEARADLDMSKDFPFLGKGTPTDYLDVVRDAVNDKSMPPWRYRILHRSSELTEQDRKTILMWVDLSEKELGAEEK
ncbi:MAG: hypothetical protein JWQ35_512 [Bacteriovoracaceae bacterium]|nr:hypothetical protein [Bacteriovoracaceae bacterium]